LKNKRTKTPKIYKFLAFGAKKRNERALQANFYPEFTHKFSKFLKNLQKSMKNP